MLIFNLHCQLVLRICGITLIYYIKTCPNVKFSLYLKKAGLASRNIVHLKKNYPTLGRFLLLYLLLYPLTPGKVCDEVPSLLINIKQPQGGCNNKSEIGIEKRTFGFPEI